MRAAAASIVSRGVHVTFPSVALRPIAGALQKKSWQAFMAATVGQHTSDPAHKEQLVASEGMLMYVASEIRALQPAMVAQVASMCAVSPVCPEHVQVILVPSSITTGMTVHGGHLLSAQQPFDPLSVPSAHGPACMVRTARRSARRFIERVERGEKRRGERDEEA